MSDIYYKAVRMDGTDFHSGTVLYQVGETVTIPEKDRGHRCCEAGVLHASVDPAATLVIGSWPCRLFQVEGEPVAKEGAKRGFHELRVTAELDAWRVFGPQGLEVVGLIDQWRSLTADEAKSLYAAWYAARCAARYTAWYTAWGAAWHAARNAAWNAAVVPAQDAARRTAQDAARRTAQDAAWDAAQDAAWALIVRDLINAEGFTQDHYDLLTRPWRTVIGPIHPADADLREQVTA